MHNLTIITFLLVFSINFGFSQLPHCEYYSEINSINDGNCINEIYATFALLNVSPNPQAAAMGHSGIAISPSTTSISVNSSNLAFSDSKFGMNFSYAPWLIQYENVKGALMGHASSYGKLNESSAIGVSFQYYSLGDIDPEFNRKKWAALLSYNKKLHPNFAMGLSLKYAYAIIVGKGMPTWDLVKPRKSIAGDLSFTYQKPLTLGGKKATLISGLAIRNIGPKNTILRAPDKRKKFLSTNLGLGLGFIHEFSKNHTLTVTCELNRLLVPTPSNVDITGDPGILDYQEKTAFQGMISSFGDAPSGLLEDFRENQYSFGLEYRYKFIVGRIGHYNEHETKGNNKQFTSGIGFLVDGLRFDFSYVVGKESRESWRFAFSFDVPADEESVPNDEIIH